MTKVVTQVDIMKYLGMDRANFPIGTIVTPSAKDWAAEHNIMIIMGQNIETSSTEKEKLLKQVITTIVKNINASGVILSKDDIINITTVSLEKLGCKING